MMKNGYFSVCLVLLAILTVLSIIPLLSLTREDMYIDRDPPNELYYVLLQVVLLVCGPLVFNQILDFHEALNEEQEQQIWSSKSLLGIGLIVPTFLELILFDTEHYQKLKLSLIISQNGFILFGILGTMFKKTTKFPKMKFCLENHTIAILTSLIFLQLFVSLYLINPIIGFYYSAVGFLIFSGVLIFFLLFKKLYQKGPKRFSFQFLHNTDYRDFSNSLVLLIFLIAKITTSGFETGTMIGILREQESIGYLMGLIVFIVVLNIITGRITVARARKGEETLKNRLDMLRYCSHEMRTPLNTAFLGLEYHSQQLFGLIECLSEENEGENSEISPKTKEKEIALKDFLKLKLPKKPSNASLSDLASQSSVKLSPKAEFRNGRNLNNGNSGITRDIRIEENGPPRKIENNEKDEETDLTVVLEGLLENIEEVKGSCNVVLQSLDELLMFDKLDEDKVSLDCNMENPWDFLEKASKPFRANAKQKNINFNILFNDLDYLWFHDFTAKIDSYRLSQVVRNFISNSLKFTSELGNVTVQLLLKKQKTCDSIKNDKNKEKEILESKSPYLMRVEVIDSGAGISKENQEKLFGQYVQFNANVLQQGKGSGLGLWISKRIIELHGGEIGAFSAGEGLGSTFFFELPLYYKNQNIPIQESKSFNTENTAEADYIKATLNTELLKNMKKENFLKRIDEDSKKTEKNNKNQKSNKNRKNQKFFINWIRSYRKPNAIGIEPTTESKSFSNSFSKKKSFLSMKSSAGDLEEGSMFDICSVDGSIGDKSRSFEGKTQKPEFETKEKQLLSHISNHLNSNLENLNLKLDTSLENDFNSFDSTNLTNEKEIKIEEYQTNSTDKTEGRLSTPKRVVTTPKSTKIRKNSVSRKMPFSPTGSDQATSPFPKSSFDLESNNKLDFKWDLGLNVLVVDDSSLNRKMLKQLLNSGGQYVEEAKNGEEAVNLLKNRFENQQWMYDVILMDSNMPIMSGPEATREIRKLNFTGLIFGVTGDTDEEQKDFFLQCGVNRVLQKPISLDTIKNAIETWDDK